MKHKRTITMQATIILTVFMLVAFLALGFMSTQQTAAAQTQTQKETYYTDAVAVKSSATETVSYSRYEVQEGNVNPYCPQYYNTNTSLSGACAPVGGAIVVGFYDRYCANLVPNTVTGYMSGTKYRYYSMSSISTPIQNVIDALYVSMGTNSQQQGTTRPQYQQGLSSYASSAGYTASFTSMMSGTSLNVSSTTTQMTNGKLITLYITDYNLTSITLGTSSATYSITGFSGNHICIAYKYKLIKYYNASNVNFRTDAFLYVCTGQSTNAAGWYYVGYSGSTLNDADATYIS